MLTKYNEINAKFQELKSEFIEMGRLKSDFDIEKFTVKKEGNFIAHNYHFLMRQYSLAMYEAKRMYLDKEEKLREIEKLNKEKKENYDIEIMRRENEIDLLDLSLRNKTGMMDKFEECRIKLIELNDGKITDEQFQAEEPEYWKWYLSKKAIDQGRERTTGISQGVWENIHYLEEPALLNEDFQVDMLGSSGRPNLLEMERNIQSRLNRIDRVELIEEVSKKSHF